ncbi:hypothetical protein [Bradyrhizobium sp. USDA 3650]
MSPRARFDLPAQLFALDEVINCAGNVSDRPIASGFQIGGSLVRQRRA